MSADIVCRDPRVRKALSELLREVSLVLASYSPQNTGSSGMKKRPMPEHIKRLNRSYDRFADYCLGGE